MKHFSPAQPRFDDPPARPTAERRTGETDADRRPSGALDSRPRGPMSIGRRALPAWQGPRNPLPENGGQALAPALRAPFEQGFAHDFSRVRIFASGETADGVQFEPGSKPQQIGESAARGIAKVIKP